MSALLAILRAVAYACRHSSSDCAPVVVRGEFRCACEFSHRKAA